MIKLLGSDGNYKNGFYFKSEHKFIYKITTYLHEMRIKSKLKNYYKSACDYILAPLMHINL